MRASSLVVLSFLLAAPAAAQARPDSTPKPPVVVTPGYGAWFGSIPDTEQQGAGIVLSGVTPASPAAKAGLRTDDILLRMDGKETPSLQEMVEVLRAHKAGDTIEVVFLRGSEQRTVKVTLGTRPTG